MTEQGSQLYHAVLELIEVLMDINPTKDSPEGEMLDRLVTAVMEYEHALHTT